MYAGKNTGSIQTTGGMDAMLESTSQRDNKRYSYMKSTLRDLTELLLNNLLLW